jgi:N-acetyl-gamma-glutamyl-phosphate reductase
MSKIRVSVVGASGYGAAEILRRLLPDPQVDVVHLVSKDDIGKRVSEVHLGLGELGADKIIEDKAIQDAIRDVDLVFLGLPHRISMNMVDAIWDSGVRIIDLSGDFRLRSVEEYERYYGTKHIAPQLLPSFQYGLPELFRSQIRSARAVASPGCFATSQILALAPLARAGWLRGPVRVVSVTGSSGSGANPSKGTHHPVRSVTLRAYRPLNHQHTPEIVQALTDVGAQDLRLDFVPVSGPLSRGILTTAFVDLPAGVNRADVEAAYGASYDSEVFVRLVKGRFPEVASIKGSQFAEVGFSVDGERLAVFCALDNLVKGGAGQAIQSFNIMMDRPEQLGLSGPATWP